MSKDKLAPVNTGTSDSIIENILMQGTLFFDNVPIVYPKDQLFSGSPRFTLKPVVKVVNGKNFYFYERPVKNTVDAFKEACQVALQGSYSEGSTELQQLENWCSEPKVKHVLKRHGFEINSDDGVFKEVIGGGWFKKENDVKYWEKQTFIKKELIDNFLGTELKESGIADSSKVKQSHILSVKYRCRALLEKPFSRKSFYMPKSYWDQDDSHVNKNLDELQEAAIFCTTPRTVEDYITKTLQGSVKGESELDTSDACYLSNHVSGLKDKKTYWPFGGNGFWCGVRLLYKPR
ncbi:hypothetical protein [Candidatus Mycoplasma haematohominis]|uniref:hypothetical protein n=1 Tax=Candidatus Mycoplasma haematohominis TaxID=1494318 RepID=UPI001C0A77C3|nr:hypothetical protein [Candidatus Mycoplasma haemohominis]